MLVSYHLLLDRFNRATVLGEMSNAICQKIKRLSILPMFRMPQATPKTRKVSGDIFPHSRRAAIGEIRRRLKLRRLSSDTIKRIIWTTFLALPLKFYCNLGNINLSHLVFISHVTHYPFCTKITRQPDKNSIHFLTTIKKYSF